MKIFDFVTDQHQSRIDDIKRFNGFHPLRIESVSQHSYWVAVFTTSLLTEMFGFDEISRDVTALKLQAINYSLFHDYLENETGDVVHDLKYNDYNGEIIKAAITEYERYLASKMLSESEDDLTAEVVFNTILTKDEFVKSIVKLSDWLACAKSTYIEILLGNQLFFNVTELIGKKTIAHIEKLESMYATFCVERDLPVKNIFSILKSQIEQHFKDERKNQSTPERAVTAE